MSSSEFNVHTGMLHDNLRTLLEDASVEIEPGLMMAAGLLNLRSDGHGSYFRPRLVVVSGAAGTIGRVIGQTVRDDLMIIGATREDDPTATMDRIFIACPGVAQDIRNRELEDGEVAKLSHSIRTAERETPGTGQAMLYYQRISEKLSQLHPA